MLRSLTAWIVVCCGAIAAAESRSPAPPPEIRQQFQRTVVPFLEAHCLDCHHGDAPEAGLDLQPYLQSTSIYEEWERWTQIRRRLRLGEMPPAESDAPDATDVQQVADWIDEAFDAAAVEGRPDPGRVTIRRLNRVEYRNTIRDLLLLDFQPADRFPADDLGYGFDTIGDVLTLSPLHLERYLEAATELADRALLTPDERRAGSRSFQADELTGGRQRPDGARLLATQGEVSVVHRFPRPGEYVVKVRAFGDQAGAELPRLAFRVGGQELQQVEVAAVRAAPQTYSVTVRREAGPVELAWAFLNDYYRPQDPDPRNRDRNLWIASAEVVGPLGADAAVLPDSHLQLLPHAMDAEDEAAIRTALARIALRTYRRPATPQEIDRLLALVRSQTESGGGVVRGFELALTAMLVSPHFLFREEPSQAPDDPRAVEALDDYAVANRLSYFLWSSMPDERLFELAASGQLRSQLQREVRRMLRDRKASALARNFGGQWLGLRELINLEPNRKQYPEFKRLRHQLRRETELLFEEIVREDRSVLEFLDADYTYLNARLAEYYGLPAVASDKFERVTLPDGRRGGVWTHASVLALTSNPTRTSPVKRGQWILEQLLGEGPAPPPPDVTALPEGPTTPLTGTVRQRMEQHRSDALCASCHARLDPLGFALENYDPVGRWRTKEGELPVDARAILPDGTELAGPEALRNWLRGQAPRFRTALARQMLIYALGRGLEYYDESSIRKIVAATEKGDNRMSSLVLAIATSDPFLRRRGDGGER